MKTYEYIVRHIPTGKTWTVKLEFESYAAFLAALRKWNAENPGVYTYT